MSGPEPFAFAGAGEWVSLAPGKARRVRLHTPELMQVEARIAAGLRTASHSHPHVQASFVLAGRIRVTVGGETRELGPGDSFVVASGLEHGATALTDVTLLDTFTPARADFLGLDRL
jgi:quercetin dioxygenase-like cupin family protein